MLNKLSDTCVVHLTPDTIALAVSATSNGGIQTCAELSRVSHRPRWSGKSPALTARFVSCAARAVPGLSDRVPG